MGNNIVVHIFQNGQKNFLGKLNRKEVKENGKLRKTTEIKSSRKQEKQKIPDDVGMPASSRKRSGDGQQARAKGEILSRIVVRKLKTRRGYIYI